MSLNTKLIQRISTEVLNNVADCDSVIQVRVVVVVVGSSHYRMAAAAVGVDLAQPQRLADWAAAVASGGGDDDGDDGVAATAV